MSRTQRPDDQFREERLINDRLRELENSITSERGAFEAWRASSSTPGGNTLISVAMNAKSAQSSDWYNIATGRYTPQAAGFYYLEIFLTAATNMSTGTVGWKVYLLKNGSIVRQLSETLQNAHPAFPRGGGSSIVYANGSTDYFEPGFLHNDFVARGVHGESPFGYLYTRFTGSRAV